MTPTRATPHLSAHAMVAQQTHIQVKCLHECHMSCMKCHHVHIPSHSPIASHMHMPSVKTVTGITNDPCIESSSAPVPNANANGQPNPSQSRLLSQPEVYVINMTVCFFGQQNFSDHTAGLLHPCSRLCT